MRQRWRRQTPDTGALRALAASRRAPSPGRRLTTSSDLSPLRGARATDGESTAARPASLRGRIFHPHVHPHGVQQPELLVWRDLQVAVAGQAAQIEAADLGAAQVGPVEPRLVEDGLE